MNYLAMASEGAASPKDSSGSAANYPLAFDLAEDQLLEARDKRRNQTFYIALESFGVCFLLAMGILCEFRVAGSTPQQSVVFFGIGGVLGVLVFLAARQIWGGAVVALRINLADIEFLLQRGRPYRVLWGEPGLKLNICEFTESPDSVLPKADARRRRPQWIDVFRPPSRYRKIETTLPVGAVKAILREAERQGIRTTRTRVAFYWQSAPRTPGWLAFAREGQLEDNTHLNGWLIELRGKAWASVQEDYSAPSG